MRSEPQAGPPKLAFNVNEIVAASGIARSMIYEDIYSGELPSFKAGKRRLSWTADVQAWLERKAGRKAA